ncbi:type II toxin-antitoxin system VapC family toxin [Kribbella qitaiheensis]|uniref:Ribonuclease VapC n=1 Tax=Kribbella qitaiheensis TaxID=1544730 RepID=A0A7G6X999_9ACTN|nr:type II toxin-antitoxin system VapC family toxin [Kribbella qitaiheensis]
MVVFDTNVASELMKAKPDETVRRWYAGRRPDGLYTTAITVAEIRRGIGRLPAGRRQERMSEAVVEIFTECVDAILPFDAYAAAMYAEIVVGRERAGRPIGPADAMIAAICRLVDATLATRDTKDFAETGVELVNPWE